MVRPGVYRRCDERAADFGGQAGMHTNYWSASRENMSCAL